METRIPRPEHPNPQFMRDSFVNLNGEWEFEFDPMNTGEERRVYEQEHLNGRITVPFSPESVLSGIGQTDFHPSLWYRRTVTVEGLDCLTLVHFGAVDYRATLYVNGQRVGAHEGGYTPASFDITPFVHPGENVLTLHAEDDTQSPRQPSGKQSPRRGSFGCLYTRTSGIWQTVYMERVPKTHIRRVEYRTDPVGGSLTVTAELQGCASLTVTALYEGRTVGVAHTEVAAGTTIVTVPLSEIHLWELGHGRLYDLTLTFGEDTVQSYFGLRSVALDGDRFLLNGRCVFQRTVLDQGFYPDGIYTAPTDEALQRDIQLALCAGFNGARLHEKVFEPRFLYHCDRMGYMVWAEYANWGFDHTDPTLLYVFMREWLEAVRRDMNHPSVIGWCPFNETWMNEKRIPSREVIEGVYLATKAADPTRPVIDTSGGQHFTTDIFDFHDYEQSPEKLRSYYARLGDEGVLNDYLTRTPKFMYCRHEYRGEPVFASEYGGIKWDVEDNGEAWGYGQAPRTLEEFFERYEGLTAALLENERMLGFCYTQLYDVEQEKNGLFTYDRQPKFDLSRIRAINTAKAAIED